MPRGCAPGRGLNCKSSFGGCGCPRAYARWPDGLARPFARCYPPRFTHLGSPFWAGATPLRRFGGATVTAEDVAAAIDELPLLALLAAVAAAATVVEGAEELRAKEADRIAAVVEGLSALGAEIEGRPDGFEVRGGGLPGGTLDARGDHRLAMVGAIAGLASDQGVEVQGFEAVSVSYPRFERDLRSLIG